MPPTLCARPSPINLSAPRNPRSGRFAPAADPCAITEVVFTEHSRIPGRVGYRVGPGGIIFADRGAAERFAVIRGAKIARAAAKPPIPAVIPFAATPSPDDRPAARRAAFGPGIAPDDCRPSTVTVTNLRDLNDVDFRAAMRGFGFPVGAEDDDPNADDAAADDDFPPDDATLDRLAEESRERDIISGMNFCI